MKLELKKLTKVYDQHLILNQISQSFESGSGISAIIGESGAGKTTLLNVLFGIDQEYEGQLLVDDIDARQYKANDWDDLRSTRVQIVYQDFKLLDNLSVSDNLNFAKRVFDEGDEFRKRQLLELLGLNEILGSDVRDISGGQKQRVAIARAMLNQPEILLMDEPTGNLDKKNTEDLLSYLRQISETGVGIFIITHDERVIPYSDSIFRLKNGELTSEKSTDFDCTGSVSAKTPQVRTPESVINRYVTTDTLKNKKEFAVATIPQILIMVIFVLLLTGYKQASLDSFIDVFKGLASNVVYIDSQTLTSNAQRKLEKQKIAASTDGQRLFFSKQDLSEVANISDVKKAISFQEANYIFDAKGNELQESIKKDALPKSFQRYKSFAAAPAEIKLGFQSMFLPKSKVDLYNPRQLQLDSGNYPIKSNEILIPDFYQKILTDQGNTGNEVGLHVRSSANKFVKKSYKISGTYKTDFQNTLKPNISIGQMNVFGIYTAYRDTVDLKTMKTRASYQDYKAAYMTNSATSKYSQNIIGSYQKYLRSIGAGKSGMLVVAKNKSDVPMISKELKSMFPMYQQKSRYSLTHGEFATTYRELVLSMFLGVALVSVVLVAIFVFLNKQILAQRRKQMSVLLSLGYHRSDLKKIISREIIIQLLCVYLGSMIVMALIKQFLLDNSSYSKYFENLYAFSNQAIIVAVLTLTMIVSVIWGLSTIKKNKLVESLK